MLRNGSAHTVNLADVVLSTRFGSAATAAEPVYEDDSAVDFAGSVRAGGVARATYLYAIPPTGFDNVAVTIDLDGLHAVARLSGRMPR